VRAALRPLFEFLKPQGKIIFIKGNLAFIGFCFLSCAL
jgi:hypothetical protein